MNYSNQQIKHIDEHITVKTKSIRKVENNKKRYRFNIIRKLKDDTFDVYIYFDKRYNCEGYVNIDNKVIKHTSIISKDRNGDDCIHFNSEFLDNSEFLKTSILTIGLWRDNDINDVVSLSIERIPNEQNSNISQNSLLDFSGIRTLECNRGEDLDNIQLNINRSHLIIEANPIDRLKFISNPYNIYIKDAYSDDLMDFSLNRFKFFTTSSPKGLEFYLHKKRISVIDIGDYHFEYVQNLLIDESTYYDYEKKKSLPGHEMNSNKGQIIPFSFKGYYYFGLFNEFWKIYEKFKISKPIKFDKPILDPNEGLIRMRQNVTNEYESIMEKNIPFEKLKLIQKEENISFEDILLINE